MKNLTIAAAFFAAVAAAPAFAQTSLSINIGQPGFYGRLDIGDYPQPQLVYGRPIIVQRPPHYTGKPVYLRVPPGHMKQWSRYCGRYGACAQQVYFVRDDWYNNSFAPRYREQHGGGERGRGRDSGDNRGDNHGDNRGDKRNDDHGRGNERGHGNGHGKD